jgi:hypothetical protein
MIFMTFLVGFAFGLLENGFWVGKSWTVRVDPMARHQILIVRLLILHMSVYCQLPIRSAIDAKLAAGVDWF